MYLHKLQQDNVFVSNQVRPLKDLLQMESRKGLENVIISNGKIVNVVSNSYGHIPNELFFGKAEQMLINAHLDYYRQSINRSDRSFAMDFIIRDRSRFVIKHSEDAILPMLRFTNSYDGSEKISGHFGFFRKVCSNGLHVATSKIEFSIKHSRCNQDLVMPSLEELFKRFLDNEFYTILQKFQQMQEVEILDTKEFVRQVLLQSKLFRYECSDTNDNPSKKAREVIGILDYESITLDQRPNLWLGYNAFNSVLHRTLKKNFSQQEKLDRQLFEDIYQMV